MYQAITMNLSRKKGQMALALLEEMAEEK